MEFVLLNSVWDMKLQDALNASKSIFYLTINAYQEITIVLDLIKMDCAHIVLIPITYQMEYA